MTSVPLPTQPLFRQYLVLTKPRVTQLAVFCAVIGMFLASPGLPELGPVVAGTVGIWLLAAAAFAVNCLIEQEIDARMLRTARSEEHTSELQSLMRISYAVFCLKKKNKKNYKFNKRTSKFIY